MLGDTAVGVYRAFRYLLPWSVLQSPGARTEPSPVISGETEQTENP